MSILSFWLWIAAIDGNSLFHPLFVPMSADERLSYAPFLIFGLLNLSLAAICFALWRVAPEHKVLRSMGYYLLIASVVPILISIGGDWLHWPLIVLASPLLISAAQDGMRIRFRRLGLILWGFAIVVILIAWLPRFAFLRSWPTNFSQVLLAALVIRAFRRNASGDREMAYLFAAYFVVRWLASEEALRAPPPSALGRKLLLCGRRLALESSEYVHHDARRNDCWAFYQRSRSGPAREVAHGRGT